ncbi:hypothetical protein KEM60_03276 [Austwickia sp. TVS 96-490-7B]|uniref:glycosyltransferase family 2 protein n=1 Tax=Austwickia sp. TVS 96-490-7B TaxID=2830843 RepID=UPI001C5835CD|nr:glycosyltransferase family 2 protein [Austwickia sp. TVS 96-490-7B]MBW3087046.1 hypothetical protein [Austwickia sp. TVS 96-490-7B]
METPLLAAALIVKNEEKFLPDCLASLNALRPLLSEICIYDTGSTDRTIEIAEAAGARVERGYWDQDFSRARNAAIAMCHAKWVLIIDADERIVADRDRLEISLKDSLRLNMTGADTLVIQIRNMVSAIRMDSQWPSNRVMRHGRIRYDGRLHEQMTLIPERLRRDVLISDEIVYLKHFGYAGDSVGTQKGERNITVSSLEVDAARDRRDNRQLATALLNRGRSYLLAGDQKSALRDFKEGRGMVKEKNIDRWLGEELAETLIGLGEVEEASLIVGSLRSEGSDLQLCDWFEAQVEWKRGRHERVADLLAKIDNPRGTAQMTLPLAEVIELRFLNAVVLQKSEEAIACGVRLMASYGRGLGHGLLLLALWGNRPLGQLAQLLYEADRGFLRGVAEEMMQYPPQGVEVARSLVAIAQAAGAELSVKAISHQSGASFGLKSLATE